MKPQIARGCSPPALMYSFLGLGLLLPVFAAVFWWCMTREQVPVAA